MHAPWLPLLVFSAGCAEPGAPIHLGNAAPAAELSSPQTSPLGDWRPPSTQASGVEAENVAPLPPVALELQWFPAGEKQLARVSAVRMTARPSAKMHLVMELVAPGGVIFQRYEGDATAEVPVWQDLLVSGTQVELRRQSGPWVVNVTGGEVKASTSFELEP
ncbi:MAG: hypothetical protein K1X64_05665 [Myxococcaceae bacterium]|nr:hypothetical protein [Myxococcaceae bacterium]